MLKEYHITFWVNQCEGKGCKELYGDDDVYYAFKTKKSALKVIRQDIDLEITNGWKVIDNKWLCPACQKKEE